MLSLSGPTLAQGAEEEAGTPLQRFSKTVKRSVALCQLDFNLAQFQIRAGSSERQDYAACIEDAKKKIKAEYPGAVKTVKKAPAKDALKAYYIKALASLDAIVATPGELKISYEQRERANVDKLNELWTSFEVENE